MGVCKDDGLLEGINQVDGGVSASRQRHRSRPVQKGVGDGDDTKADGTLRGGIHSLQAGTDQLCNGGDAKGTRDIPGYFGGLADGTSTSAWGNQILKAHSFVLGWTHIFSPTIVNEFRFGCVRNFSYAQQQPFTLPQTANQFVPGIPPSPQIGGGVPLTTFSNFAFLGSADFLPKKQIPQLLQYNDTVSITHGKQTLKVWRQRLLGQCATSSRMKAVHAATSPSPASSRRIPPTPTACSAIRRARS